MAGSFSLFSNLMGAPQRMQMGSLADLMANPAGAMHQAVAPKPKPRNGEMQKGEDGKTYRFEDDGAEGRWMEVQQESATPRLDNFKRNLGDVFSPENLSAFGAMAGGRTFGDSLGGFLQHTGQNLTTKRQKNKTLDYLTKNNPDLAAMVAAGMPINEAWQAALKKSKAGNDTTYSLSPIYGTDPKTGKTVLGTVGNDGTFKTIDTGGFDVAAGVDKVDLGTQWMFRDKRTGQVVGFEPKDVRGEEREKEIGTAEGKAAAAAPSDFTQAANALTLVESLRNDPNRERGTGASGALGNWIPSSRGYDFQRKVDQAKAGAFLSAIEQLRGMGALSNAEGQTATAAVTRISTASSEEEFLAALADYERIIRQGLERSQATMGKFGTGQGMPLPQAPAPQAAPSGGGQRLRFNPSTGKLE